MIVLKHTSIMRKIIISLSFTLFTLGISNVLYGQVNKKVLNWYNGNGAGMQTEKGYKNLKNHSSTTVIVAVVDSGIDIEHEDLKGKIWTNVNEIPNNGIDDDKNGYIDDIHGWNFLGNAKGENVNETRLEKTRILSFLAKKYEEIDPESISESDKSEYDLYLKVKSEVDADREMYTQYIARMDLIPTMIDQVPTLVGEKLGKTDYTVKDLDKWKPETEDMKQMKRFANALLTGAISKEAIQAQKEQIQVMLDYHLNPEFDDRSLIGDNPLDFTDNNYGNNNVEGPDALHGTHVGGIIGAVRGNGLGGDGVCENVQLMVLRAVPNGDENDKDIALSVRYAVDNGAQVINMSFGKAYSPNQKEVYEAFKYADSKGVLLVHAAGNDNANVDEDSNFPTSLYSFQTEKLDLFLTIGASTRTKKKNLAADFSNYGQTKVDVFAPGFEIYNSVPQSDYKVLQGTSMAAPMVAGVAAMLKSYFPTLTMNEIKDVMLESSKKYTGTEQHLPGSEQLVDFGTLSVTGGVINVKNAVKMCLELEKSKVVK
jgi:cell wall-associated protease